MERTRVNDSLEGDVREKIKQYFLVYLTGMPLDVPVEWLQLEEHGNRPLTPRDAGQYVMMGNETLLAKFISRIAGEAIQSFSGIEDEEKPFLSIGARTFSIDELIQHLEAQDDIGLDVIEMYLLEMLGEEESPEKKAIAVVRAPEEIDAAAVKILKSLRSDPKLQDSFVDEEVGTVADLIRHIEERDEIGMEYIEMWLRAMDSLSEVNVGPKAEEAEARRLLEMCDSASPSMRLVIGDQRISPVELKMHILARDEIGTKIIRHSLEASGRMTYYKLMQRAKRVGRAILDVLSGF